MSGNKSKDGPEDMEGVEEQLPERGSQDGDRDMDITDSGVSENAGAIDISGDTTKPEGSAKRNITDKPADPKSPRLTSIPGISSSHGVPANKPGINSPPGSSGKKSSNAKTGSTDRTTGPFKGNEQARQGRTGLRSGGDVAAKLEDQARKAGKPDTKDAGKSKQNGVKLNNEVETKKKKSNQYCPDDHGTGATYQGYDQGNPQGQGHYHGWYQDPQSHDGHGRRDQMQEHIFRQAQASKQMVYGVFGNCITMLEEMETRELRKEKKKALPRSDIYLPDQSKFDDKTIKTKLDTQLILLQAQLTSCHDSIRDEVKDELKANTLHWASEREEKKITEGMTDDYVAKLFGLLDTGKADHPREFDQPPTIDEKGIHKALGAMMQGNQKRAELDKDFKNNPNKKASGPNMRPTAGIDKGADRIARVNPEHEHAVDSYREGIC